MIQKLLIILIFCLGLVRVSVSQVPDYPYDLPQYPFIRYSQNVINFYGDSSSYERIYKKLDHMIFEGKGNLSIAHFGGSHVQAGFWTGEIRERFQQFYPGLQGEPGFVFPYRMTKTNMPASYWATYTGNWDVCRNVERKRHCLLGVSGISATTFDSLAGFKIYPRKYVSFASNDFNAFKIFHDFPHAYEIVLADSNIHYIREEFPEFGYTQFTLDDYYDTLAINIFRIDTIHTGFRFYGIKLENDNPGISYHAFGINGAAVPSYLRCELFQQQLAYYLPDLVILSIGINDAYGKRFDPNHFEKNYDTLITRIREVNPDCAILLTTNNDSYLYRRYANRNGEKVRQTMIRLAKKYNAAVWDMYTVMGGLNSIVLWQNAGLAKPDKIHFTKPGYKLVGDLLFTAFLKSYDSHLERAKSSVVNY